jgi:type II secretory pathway component PulF
MLIPVVKDCMRDFALAWFAWVYSLTQQTDLPVTHSLRAALKATDHGVFMDQIPLVCGRIEEGDELSQALRSTGLFPEEFLQTVEFAEVSGTVPEMLERLSPELEARALRSLAALAAALGWVIWMLNVALTLFFIYRITVVAGISRGFCVSFLNRSTMG